jgi:hypothetical protein
LDSAVRLDLAKLLGRAVPLLALLAFVGLASCQLELPGLDYDEAFDVVPAMQLLLGQQVDTLAGSGLRIGGTTLPVMVMDYKGVVHTYWALPFLWSLGISTFALRLSCLFLSLLTLAATYRFARRAFGGWAAGATVLLAATNPSFIFWSRQGVLWTNAMLACGMGALAALGSYTRERRRVRLWAAAFLLGLGLSAKLAFFWFPVALGAIGAAAAAIRLWRSWRERLAGDRVARSGDWRSLAALWGPALLAFLLGLAPVLMYNVQTEGTVNLIRDHLQTSYYGVENLAWLANLSLRWEHLQMLLGSTGFWYLGAVAGDPVFLRAFWIGAAVLVVASAWGAVSIARKEQANRSGDGQPPSPGRAYAGALLPLLPLAMMALMFLQSGVTVSGLWPEHYLLLLPFPQLVVALAVDRLRRVAGGRRAATVLAGLAVGFLVWWQVGVAMEYHVALAGTGGLGAHSEANYALADYLAAEGRPVVAMDWGIKMQTQFLTAGKLQVVECFGYESLESPAETFAACAEPHLGRPETCYVFHSPAGTVFAGRLEALQELAGERGLSLVLRQEIRDRRGEVIFLVVETGGTSEAVP